MNSTERHTSTQKLWNCRFMFIHRRAS